MEGYEKEFQPNKLAHKVSLFTTYPTAACARGVVVDTRIVAPTQVPVGSVATGRCPPSSGANVVCMYRTCPPDSEPPVGDEGRA